MQTKGICGMFIRTGTKLKQVVKLCMIAAAVSQIAIGALVWYLLAEIDYGFAGFLAFAAMIAFAVAAAWLSVLGLHAYIELAKAVTDIDLCVEMLLSDQKQEGERSQ